MKYLRMGVMSTSLSVAIMLGGSALAQTEQRPQEPPAATSPSTTAPDNNARPMSEQPNMGVPQDSQQQPMDRDNTARPQDRDQRADQDRDRDNMGHQGNDKLNRQQVGELDKFMDKHPEVAEDLRKDPAKVNDEGWVRNHKEFAKFLDKHPQIREELKENPSAVMNRENRYEKNENRPQ
jgi:hypothetical protein